MKLDIDKDNIKLLVIQQGNHIAGISLRYTVHPFFN